MIEKITLDKLQENLDFFHKMYDMVRLVDPIHKKVIEYRNNDTKNTRKTCYNYWGNGKICENCISVRAYREQKSFIKLEHSPNEVMLVTALPIGSVKEPMVLELLKNATNTMMIGTGEYTKGEEFFNAVHDLSNMIIRDELTSLYNRRFLDERLPADIAAAVANKKPLSLIFIDIDNMKMVNDTYGHAAGDKLLECASKVIKGCIRSEMDWAARYGGDEFVVCLNKAGEEAAFRVCEQIENALNNIRFSVRQTQITIKASLGVITMPDDGMNAEELVNLADKSMYASKRVHKKINE
jgi:two-component system cell cycle response regulator